MSELDRNISSALSQKSKTNNKKPVQSESQLISSLNQAFQDKKKTEAPRIAVSGKEMERELDYKLNQMAEAPDEGDFETDTKADAIDRKTFDRKSSLETDTKVSVADVRQNVLKEKNIPSFEKQDTVNSVFIKDMSSTLSNDDSLKREKAQRETVPYRHNHSGENSSYRASGGGNSVLGFMLTIFLIVSGITGSLLFCLSSEKMIDLAMKQSGCAASFETDFWDMLNERMARQGRVFDFTSEAVPDGQIVFDLKKGLSDVLKTGSYDLKTVKTESHVLAYVEENGGSLEADEVQAVGQEFLSFYQEKMDDFLSFFSIIGNGLFKNTLLLIFAFSVAICLILFLIMRRNSGWSGHMIAEKVSFGISALLLSAASAGFLITGVTGKLELASKSVEILCRGFFTLFLMTLIAVAAGYFITMLSLMIAAAGDPS
ncbi:MAG: hypothetical protein K6E30_06505 [Lachnospiraceae bacterium]|nr:hypothetical protein [Lachnospiraceae bacterium]